MKTHEATFRYYGRCSRALGRDLVHLARWIGIPLWLLVVVMLVLCLVAIALNAYVGRRRRAVLPRRPLARAPAPLVRYSHG